MRQFDTQLNEVRTRNCYRPVILWHVTTKWRSELLVVGNVWVARHAEVVLHATLGWQTVVIPTHWIEHALAAHAPKAGNGVGVCVTKYVSHVQRTADGWRRGVNGENLVARCVAIEGIDARLLPFFDESGFQVVEGWLFRDVHRGSTVLERNSAWHLVAPLGLTRAAFVRHRYARGARTENARARQVGHLFVWPNRVRATAFGSRSSHIGVRHFASLFGMVWRAGSTGVQYHRH